MQVILQFFELKSFAYFLPKFFVDQNLLKRRNLILGLICHYVKKFKEVVNSLISKFLLNIPVRSRLRNGRGFQSYWNRSYGV